MPRAEKRFFCSTLIIDIAEAEGLDDLYYAARNCHRMVNVHLNDGAAGKAPDEQRDMVREMPMTTGMIDSAMVYGLFKENGYQGPVMCEPMAPATDRFAKAPQEQSIAEVMEAFRRVEKGLINIS